MNSRTLTLLGVALMLVAAALVWPPLATFFKVDSCLDAGGSFNYVTGECDFETNQPYGPADNTLRLRAAATLALIGSAITIFGRYRRRRVARER